MNMLKIVVLALLFFVLVSLPDNMWANETNAGSTVFKKNGCWVQVRTFYSRFGNRPPKLGLLVHDSFGDLILARDYGRYDPSFIVDENTDFVGTTMKELMEDPRVWGRKVSIVVDLGEIVPDVWPYVHRAKKVIISPYTYLKKCRK